MKLSSAIQEAVVCLILFDPEAGPVLRGLLPSRTFDPFYREIVEEADQYWEKYSKPPGEHALDIVDALAARDQDKASVFKRVWESLEETKGSINQQYVMEQATLFARYQRLRMGIGEALDALELDDAAGVLQAESVLEKATAGTLDLFDPGTYLRDAKSLRFLDDDLEAFPTGIPELDAKGLGPARGRLHLMIAPYGVGKSWWLVHLAKVALMHGLRVLYLTLEMSEAEVSERLHRALFALGRRSGKATWFKWEKDDRGRRVVGLVEKKAKKRPYIYGKGIKRVLQVKRKVLDRRPPILIKNFPTGTLTTRECRAYLDALESTGFIPDLLLVDYADLFALPAENYRIGLGTLYKDLRGIGQARHIGVATASQMNRAGAGKKVGTGRDVAEDWSKMGTVDIAFTLNQTPPEKDLGMCRLFVDKGRSDSDKFEVHLCQNLDLGQFVVDSSRMVAKYWEIVGGTMNEEGIEE